MQTVSLDKAGNDARSSGSRILLNDFTARQRLMWDARDGFQNAPAFYRRTDLQEVNPGCVIRDELA